MSQLRVTGFAGSLRRESYNRALLRAAADVASADVEFTIIDLIDVPLFNADVEATGDPDSVAALKRAIHDADLVVIATPEYNQTIPAVPKNAIDWASRPPKPQAWDGKPVAIMGASPGRFGTVSAQRALRETLAGVNARVMPQPRVMLSGAAGAFREGVLVDDDQRDRLERFMAAAVAWARVFAASGHDR
jgi:chromate reductase